MTRNTQSYILPGGSASFRPAAVHACRPAVQEEAQASPVRGEHAEGGGAEAGAIQSAKERRQHAANHARPKQRQRVQQPWLHDQSG